MNDRPVTPKNQANCDELRDLIPAYGMGIADADEIALIEANLENCPDLQAELTEYEEIHAAMLLSVPQVTPPSTLKSALMQATTPAQPVLKESKAPIQLQAMQPTVLPRRTNYWRYVAAACIALLLFSNIFWLSQNSAIQGELQNARDETTALYNQLNQEPEFLRGLGQGNPQRVELNPHEDESEATLVWVPGHNDETWIGWFVSRQLPQLNEANVYQGWLIREGHDPLSIGVFTVDSASSGAFVFEIAEPIGNFDLVGVTVEPMGGSEQPTTDPIALGEI